MESDMTNTEPDLAFKVHDLRNSINGALSFLQLLTKRNAEPGSQKYLAHSVEALEHATKTTEEISVLLEPGSTVHDLPPDRDVVIVSAFSYLGEHVAREYEEFARLYPLDIKFSYHLLEEDKNVAFNPAQVFSLRQNIVTNALDAGATELKIHYEMKDYCFVLTFTDNGRGMNEDEVNQLLLKQHGDGRIHGLGTKAILSTAYEHQAVVTYSSQPGQGTQVKILLPYVK